MASNRLCRDTSERIVILDSNAVMMLFEFSINLDNEITYLVENSRILVPQPVIDELKYLSLYGKGKKKKIAKPSLDLIRKYAILDIDNDLIGDDAILYLAKKHNAFVVTNDKKLRKRLKDISLRTIFLRSKNHLVLE